MKSLPGILVCVLLLAGCASSTTSTGPDAPPSDETRAAALWTQIQGYQEWDHPLGYDGVVEGDSVHGDYVSFFLNSKAAKTFTEPEAGSIVVKEGFDEEGGPIQAITVMQKIPGAYPEQDDWLFARFDPAGKPSMVNSARCIRCHRKADGDDYLFVND